MGTKKKEALIQFNRNNILAAAKKLFETKGIETATMDEIAREADYSKSTVYVYFKSKEDILEAILAEHFSNLYQAFKEVIENFRDLESCYLEICQILADFQDKYPVYFERLLKKINIDEADIKMQNVRYEIYKTGEQINKLIETVLKRGIEDGKLRKDMKLLPTVLYLWSGISSIISFAQEKQTYLKLCLHMTKEEYMQYSFGMLLDSLRVSV